MKLLFVYCDCPAVSAIKILQQRRASSSSVLMIKPISFKMLSQCKGRICQFRVLYMIHSSAMCSTIYGNGNPTYFLCAARPYAIALMTNKQKTPTKALIVENNFPSNGSSDKVQASQICLFLRDQSASVKPKSVTNGIDNASGEREYGTLKLTLKKWLHAV